MLYVVEFTLELKYIDFHKLLDLLRCKENSNIYFKYKNIKDNSRRLIIANFQLIWFSHRVAVQITDR